MTLFNDHDHDPDHDPGVHGHCCQGTGHTNYTITLFNDQDHDPDHNPI